ncbi:MAG: thioredoxin domain-containing protein [Planctomycetota bacterium]|nr:MAG: thioredoxin domain-containing protein [Planctomycetota bacterium]
MVLGKSVTIAGILAGVGLLISGSILTGKGGKTVEGKTIEQKPTNRLINESSPYLLQHAHNPVDWYPWGNEAFERAKKEDKPIFLSIGYSTCHWCHVMEHESFENEQIAKIMNEHFVNIKVDREQRPDVDKIYMSAVQLMTGSGGWPLSVFLTPDGKPFYGGTYFPPNDMFGRPGFERLLLGIADAWNNRRAELVDSAGKLGDFLASSALPTEKEDLSVEMLEGGFNYLRNTFDARYGGFGSAPKFPQPTNLSFLLYYWQRTGAEQALQMVEKTLDAMAKGGMYDHIGGGFHRYSTDGRWLVPHFEKMLYDQALISKAYLQAYQATTKKEYARIAEEIFDYVLRDMTDAKGGFYSAEDADSEGKEGTFYLWKPKEIESILDTDQAEIFSAYYGVTEQGNFEEGKTILNITSSVEQLVEKVQKDEVMTENILAEASSKVFNERQKRIRPHRDDKVITGWNGLMISSLAYGRAVLQEQEYTKAAGRAAQFILSTLHKNGRLMRYYRNGRVVGLGFLDDYAFMIMGLVDLYEATFNAEWLIHAKKLADEMIQLFGDEEHGGFYLTGTDGEKLIARTKPDSDGAIASGNSVAALALLRLGRITTNQQYTEQATKTLEAFSQQLEQSPGYSSVMLMALNFWLGPTQEIVIAGGTNAEDTKQMLGLVRGKLLPNAVVLFHGIDQAGKTIENIVPFLKGQVAIDGKATAYVCENYVCNQPVTTIKGLNKMLAGSSRVGKR